MLTPLSLHPAPPGDIECLQNMALEKLNLSGGVEYDDTIQKWQAIPMKLTGKPACAWGGSVKV